MSWPSNPSPLADQKDRAMTDDYLEEIYALLDKCSTDEEKALFDQLRQRHRIHPYEDEIGAPAEMVLEAIHRAPELTRRMLRGVVADAAFATFVIPPLEKAGWKDTTPEGNFAYDYVMSDANGNVRVQVKLQRSEKGEPVKKSGDRFGFETDVFFVETQKTRGGNNRKGERTRPYRVGEFDIIAVSMQPSTKRWNDFMYCPTSYLIRNSGGYIATMQPVSAECNEYWTDDFQTVVSWIRSQNQDRIMRVYGSPPFSLKGPRRTTRN